MFMTSLKHVGSYAPATVRERNWLIATATFMSECACATLLIPTMSVSTVKMSDQKVPETKHSSLIGSVGYM